MVTMSTATHKMAAKAMSLILRPGRGMVAAIRGVASPWDFQSDNAPTALRIHNQLVETSIQYQVCCRGNYVYHLSTMISARYEKLYSLAREGDAENHFFATASRLESHANRSTYSSHV